MLSFTHFQCETCYDILWLCKILGTPPPLPPISLKATRKRVKVKISFETKFIIHKPLKHIGTTAKQLSVYMAASNLKKNENKEIFTSCSFLIPSNKTWMKRTGIQYVKWEAENS